ncbi:hypothetical protein, partial [Streptomyces sp. AcH 505]|uniref:hypothetical protein n=1 Tax=Streptomyces sp. AcH 505 TaxID=352211 RepID=UPI0019D6C44D
RAAGPAGMISEPELVGGQAVPAPRRDDDPPGAWRAGAPDPAAPDDPEAPPETIAADGLPPHRRPWVWGLCGALLASAGWAAWIQLDHSAGPDLRGYRVSRNLCLDAELPALSAALGTERLPKAVVDERETVDRSFCMVELTPEGKNGREAISATTKHATVDISYVLHRKTDPGPEFEAIATGPASAMGPTYTAKLVPDLGERAYVLRDAAGNSLQLMVLDGQAVITAEVQAFTEFGTGPGAGNQYVHEPLEPDVVEPALVADIRDLMTKLSK